MMGNFVSGLQKGFLQTVGVSCTKGTARADHGGSNSLQSRLQTMRITKFMDTIFCLACNGYRRKGYTLYNTLLVGNHKSRLEEFYD